MARLLRDPLLYQIKWKDIDTTYLHNWANWTKEEDLLGLGLSHQAPKAGDATTEALQIKGQQEAKIVAREDMTVAGLGMIPYLLFAYNGQTECQAVTQDGQKVSKGETLAILQGDAATLLMAERPILNILQRLSGIASHTAKYVTSMGPTKTKLLDTRKTTPGLRVLEKYAVACGGAFNHRFGLFDRMMIKDNHIAAAKATTNKSLSEIVAEAKKNRPDLVLEVEVDSLQQIPQVLISQPDILLLDNFSNQELVVALKMIQQQAYTEASGGITQERLPEIADLGLDFISIGGLTHQAKAVDIALDWA